MVQHSEGQPQPMGEERLREIEQRAAQATPGPWESTGDAVPWRQGHDGWFDDRGASINAYVEDGFWHGVVVGGLQDEQGGAVGILTNEDAVFIAHARTDIPDLLAEVRRLRAERDTLRDALRLADAALTATQWGGECDCWTEPDDDVDDGTPFIGICNGHCPACSEPQAMGHAADCPVRKYVEHLAGLS